MFDEFILEDMIFKQIWYDDTPRLRLLMRSLEKYNRLAYKQLIFKDRFEELTFKPMGDLFEAELITDDLFKKVYGTYRVIADIRNKQVKVLYIEPEELLTDGYIKILETYKGVPYRNSQDLFKIKLAESLINDN